MTAITSKELWDQLEAPNTQCWISLSIIRNENYNLLKIIKMVKHMNSQLLYVYYINNGS